MTNLFYQTKSPRQMLKRAEGIHMWDTDGKRYIDGSSGAMVSNIGHSNPEVLAAMRAQMDQSTFGYRGGRKCAEDGAPICFDARAGSAI